MLKTSANQECEKMNAVAWQKSKNVMAESRVGWRKRVCVSRDRLCQALKLKCLIAVRRLQNQLAWKRGNKLTFQILNQLGGRRGKKGNTIKICLGKKIVVAKVRDDRCIMNTKCIIVCTHVYMGISRYLWNYWLNSL